MQAAAAAAGKPAGYYYVTLWFLFSLPCHIMFEKIINLPNVLLLTTNQILEQLLPTTCLFFIIFLNKKLVDTMIAVALPIPALESRMEEVLELQPMRIMVTAIWTTKHNFFRLRWGLTGWDPLPGGIEVTDWPTAPGPTHGLFVWSI